MAYVQIGRDRIHFVQFGPDQTDRFSPVLFVHGAGASHQIWLYQLRALGSKRKVMALDLPGHGGSSGEGADRIEAYRDLVKAFAAALGLDRIVLAGHSMGGAITQSFALAYPERLAGVILVGTGARLRVHPKILTGLREDATAAVELVARWARSPDASAEAREEDVQAMLRTSGQVIEGDFRACDCFDLMDRVSEITAPALVISGTDDMMTPPKYARYLHQQIKGSQLALVEGAGHMVMLERPDEVIRAMETFLDRLMV